MDKETYEALKNLIMIWEEGTMGLNEGIFKISFKQVKDWIDETEKEYEE